MSKKCELTGKSPLKGHKVSHANNKMKRKFFPNIKNVTFKRNIWSTVNNGTAFVDGELAFTIIPGNLYHTSLSGTTTSIDIIIDEPSVYESFPTRIKANEIAIDLISSGTPSEVAFVHTDDISTNKELLYYNGYILAPGTVDSTLNITPYKNIFPLRECLLSTKISSFLFFFYFEAILQGH